MGLDVYVGSYTRYYSGDWETVMQRYGREQGLPVKVIRQRQDADAVTDPDQIRPAIVAWRDQLSAGLGENLDRPLDWDESLSAPYFTDKPAWDPYGALLLWAAYADYRDLDRPTRIPEDWTTDLAYVRSQTDANSSFGQLLRDVQVWLPVDFPFVFRAADPTGAEIVFGSAAHLLRQLERLNHRTWQASATDAARWRLDGAERGAPLEIGAQFAFAIISDLARDAMKHRLIMKLDY